METTSKNEYRDIIANRIKELRTSHNLTMEEFGKILGLTKTSISRWESGSVDRMKSVHVQMLSNYFNVSPGWLLGLNVPKEITSDTKQQLINEINEKLLWLNETNLKKLLKFIDDYL